MSGPADFAVFIVDDDAAVRDALSLLLGVYDYRVTLFANAESFLSAYRADWEGVLLIDIRIPENKCPLPVIIMTGHGDHDAARTRGHGNGRGWTS